MRHHITHHPSDFSVVAYDMPHDASDRVLKILESWEINHLIPRHWLFHWSSFPYISFRFELQALTGSHDPYNLPQTSYHMSGGKKASYGTPSPTVFLACTDYKSISLYIQYVLVARVWKFLELFLDVCPMVLQNGRNGFYQRKNQSSSSMQRKYENFNWLQFGVNDVSLISYEAGINTFDTANVRRLIDFFWM
jgi:hypothetical protein